MARFSFMCVYLLLPIFAICQFLKKEMFLYIGIARHQYFKGKTVRKEFSYMNPLQNFFKEMHFFFFLFPLLSTSSFPYLLRYSSVGTVGEYPLWGLSVHKHLLSDIIGKMQQPSGQSESREIPSERAACGHHLGLWQFSYQLQRLLAAFQSTAQACAKLL